MHNLSDCNGGLNISRNSLLSNLDFLNNLTTLGWGLNIISNPIFSDIKGLGHLTNINFTIDIEDNPELISLKGLENINPGTITGVILNKNKKLSYCEIENICQYLFELTDSYINNNAPGCNSREEVEAACLAGIENMIQENELSIFPNPSSSRFTIQFSLENEEQVKLLVLNNLGQVVAIVANETLSEGQHELNWNAEGMPAGVYFYNIQIGNQAGTGKLVLMK